MQHKYRQKFGQYSEVLSEKTRKNIHHKSSEDANRNGIIPADQGDKKKRSCMRFWIRFSMAVHWDQIKRLGLRGQHAREALKPAIIDCGAILNS